MKQGFAIDDDIYKQRYFPDEIMPTKCRTFEYSHFNGEFTNPKAVLRSTRRVMSIKTADSEFSHRSSLSAMQWQLQVSCCNIIQVVGRDVSIQFLGNSFTNGIVNGKWRLSRTRHFALIWSNIVSSNIIVDLIRFYRDDAESISHWKRVHAKIV